MLVNALHLYISYAVFQGLVIAVILFSLQRGHRTSNRLQAYWLLSLSLGFLDYLLKSVGVYEQYPHTIYLLSSCWALSPALLYLYVLSYVGGPSKPFGWRWLHLTPFLLSLLFLLPFLFSPGSEKLSIYKSQSESMIVDFNSWRDVVSGFYSLQATCYGFLGARLLSRELEHAKNGDAGEAIQYLSGLRNLVAIYGLYIVVEFIVALLMLMFSVQWEGFIALSLAVCATVIHLVGFMAIKQPERFVFPGDGKDALQPDELIVPSNDSVEKVNVQFSDKDRIVKELTDLLENQLLYRQGDLSVAVLAEQLELSPRNLSRFINQEMNTNFFDLVNGYRIKEAQRLLRTEKKGYNILNIALEVGFQSKSTFNRIFKKHTGQTPSAYAKEG